MAVEWGERWVLNDLQLEKATNTVAPLPSWGWIAKESEGVEFWMPHHSRRFSAGVPLRTVRPRCMILTHLGKILLITDLEKNELEFVTLSSFLDGLHAVRRKFERELTEGRRTANTGEERVANLRACREEMMAKSDRMVKEHMKVLPVQWKDGVAGKCDESSPVAVLRLTTPDGLPIEAGVETHVAVLTQEDNFLVRFTKAGSADARTGGRLTPDNVMRRCVSDRCSTRSYRLPQDTVELLRYVRDPNTNKDAVLMSEIAKLKAYSLRPVEVEGDGAGRWLVFVSHVWQAVAIGDTKTNRIAHLPMDSAPTGVIETAKGDLLMYSHEMWTEIPEWQRKFDLHTLLSLDFEDFSAFEQPVDTTVLHKPVTDKELFKAAFRYGGDDDDDDEEEDEDDDAKEEDDGENDDDDDDDDEEEEENGGGIIRRRKDRHPGHYWVVAGWGPVPTRLRAPEHIYVQLKSRGEVEKYQNLPCWTRTEWEPEPWIVGDVGSDEMVSTPVWIGVVNLRDGVTAESIKVAPKTDAWRKAVSMVPNSVEIGDFLVTGNMLSMYPPLALDVPVTPGRWKWKARHDGHDVELTLHHESVEGAEIESCSEWKAMTHKELPKFQNSMARMNELAPAITEEGFRVKIAEYSEPLRCARAQNRHWIMMVDKNVLPAGEPWDRENLLSRDFRNEEVRVTGLSCGIAISYDGAPCLYFVAKSKRIVRIRCQMPSVG